MCISVCGKTRTICPVRFLEVEPYEYEFRVHAKQRWLGQSLLEVFAKEFIAFSRESRVARGEGSGLWSSECRSLRALCKTNSALLLTI